MPRYIAFLRAINVGGRYVPMETLRGHFSAAGFTDVGSFIASGNILFSTRAKAGPALERKVEQMLAATLGFEVPTFIRTPEQVAAAVERRVFPDAALAASAALMVGFLKQPLDAAAVNRLAALNDEQHTFTAAGTELYWLLSIKQSEAAITPTKIERALGGPTTMRSITSLRKLAVKHCQGPGPRVGARGPGLGAR
jgi:uncharacterized protein (DUF1697 family)